MPNVLHKQTERKVQDKNDDREKINKRRENICRAIRCVGYGICLSLAIVNSWAIFQSYICNIKVRSTKVVPSPGNVLDSPTILVCNSTAYKNQILPTTTANYKENTMNMSDFLVEAMVVKDAGRKGVLSLRPKSIKEKVREVATMFQGTCIMLEETIQVV